jgi:''Cold-shock'' DNA-binding domain.
MMTDTRIQGKIIKISKSGWGFISSKEIEFTRIFFHWTSLRQDSVPFLELRTGMPVEFIALQIPGKGWRAVHVRVMEKVKMESTNDEPETTVSALPE